MPHDVRVHHADSIPLAVVRRQATRPELPRVIPECCGLVWNVVRQQGARGGRHVALYRSVSADGVMQLEIGVEVPGPFDDSGEVVRSATPAGLVASATHLGPYNQLRGAHDAVHQWCRDNNRHLAGQSWEIYGHWQDAWNQDPSQIRTDIYYLLQDR